MTAQPEAKPFLKWVGGKRALLPFLLPLVPREIETYHEPMVGGGALFFALAVAGRFKRAFLSDINRELIATYRAIKDEPDAVLEELSRHTHSRDHFMEIRRLDPSQMDGASVAARMIFLNRVCFNGLYRLNRRDQFNVDYGRYPTMTTFADPDNIHACSRALANVTLAVCDFNDEVHAGAPGDFFYFDPPYVPVSETSSFTGYVGGGFDRQDQSNLSVCAARLAERGVSVMVSNSDCDWVRRAYAGFDIIEASRAGGMNSDAQKRGRVGELIARSRDPEVGATAHRQGRASLGDVPATERLSRYCPHGDRGMQNAPEEAAQVPYRRATPGEVKAEGVTAGRDPQLFEGGGR